MTKKLTPAMLEALAVANVHGLVHVGDQWVRGTTNYVKSGSICGLIDRKLVTAVAGEHRLTRSGYMALRDAGVISPQRYEQEMFDRQEIMDRDHAEAHEINDKLAQIGRLEQHGSVEARLAAYSIRDELLAAGFAEQAISDVRNTGTIPTRWSASLPECGHEHRCVRCADCDDVMDRLHAEALKISANVRSEFEPGDTLRNPNTGQVFEVIEWTHAVIVRNNNTGLRSAVPADMAREFERVTELEHGDNLAAHFSVEATHHHIDLPIVRNYDAENAFLASYGQNGPHDEPWGIE